MDEAFSRFEADLANVGQQGLVPPPPHLPPPGLPPPPVMMGAPPGMPPPPFPGGMPPPPQYMHPPPQAAYPPPAQQYYGQPPMHHQGPPRHHGTGTIASLRASQGLPVSSPYDDPDHGVPPMPKGVMAGDKGKDAKPEKKGLLREAAGKRWRDPTLDEWPDNDFRIFVGDLGNDVNDDALAKAFQKYPSFNKAKIVKDKRTKKSKGYGFVSFMDSNDFAKALKEMQGKYIGNRPVKLRKSTWEERNPNLPPQNKKQKQQKQ